MCVPQLLGFNCLRIPFSFSDLFNLVPRNFDGTCAAVSAADIQASVTDPAVAVPDGRTIPAQARAAACCARGPGSGPEPGLGLAAAWAVLGGWPPRALRLAARMQVTPTGNPPTECNADLPNTSVYQRFLHVVQAHPRR